MQFTVTVSHDEAERVWFVQSSDVPGLNAEAPTLDELVQVIADVAPDLIASNLPDADLEERRRYCLAGSARRDRTPCTGNLIGLEFSIPNWHGGYVRRDACLCARGRALMRFGFSPLSNRRFSVPRSTVKVHAANNVLKDAGLPKGF
jgi:hypothetical protein